MHGVKNLGILEYRRVEQTVCCYVPGEVSHIENVLAREFKEKHTRNFISTEVTQENTSSRDIESMTDTSTTDRNEISSEVSRVLASERSQGYGGSLSVSGSYMGAEIGVDAYMDFSSSNSSSQSNADAQSYAKEVVARAVEKVVTKTQEKRTSRILKEFEENNRHGFDNRDGDEHVAGVYRWIDKIFDVQIVNYGRQMIAEFYVPQPAKFYLEVQERLRKAKAEQAAQGLEKPKTLADFGITDRASFTEDNLKAASDHFGVTLPQKPDPKKVKVLSYTPSPALKHKRGTASQAQPSVVVPDAYRLTKASGHYSYEYRANSWTNDEVAFCDMSIGGVKTSSGGDYSGDKKTKSVGVNSSFSPGLDGTVPVIFTFAGTFTFSGSITYTFTLDPEVTEAWELEILAALKSEEDAAVAAYEAELDAISQEIEAAESESGKSVHPAQKRLIEQRELKRACIEMLMRPYCHDLGQSFYSDRENCDHPIPEIVQTPELDRYIEFQKLFEDGLKWNLMSYTFNPYYWAFECDWASLISVEDDDLTFAGFLQAGSAKVLVPVGCAQAANLLFYIQTGNPYSGGEVIGEDEADLYASILAELEDCNEEIIIEETFQSRVPSTLTLLQKGSALIDEAGLPCCDEAIVEGTRNSLIEHNKNLERLSGNTADDPE